MIAYLGNWRECPTAEQVAQYTHIVIAFAVSYTWNPSKNQCSQTRQIADPPICNNSPNPGLVQQWQAAGKKVILSFGGAGMGGSWAGDNNDCWEFCYGREAQVTNRLVEIVKDMNLDGIDIDFEYHVTPRAVTFLNEITAGLKDALPAGSEITHAPMDSDVIPGKPYFDDVLMTTGHLLDFLMPQYYNGVTRPALDGIDGSGAGSMSALSHYTNIVNDVFGGDATRMVFGHCISDCAGTGSNVNAAQASVIMTDLAEAYPCNGGAFFWVVHHDSGGSWSGPVKSAIDGLASTRCSSIDPDPTPNPVAPAPTRPPTRAPTPSPTQAPVSDAGCCSQNYLDCSINWCGTTKQECEVCGDRSNQWLPSGPLPAGTCLKRWEGCAGSSKSCCSPATCRDNGGGFMQCLADTDFPPIENPTTPTTPSPVPPAPVAPNPTPSPVPAPTPSPGNPVPGITFPGKATFYGGNEGGNACGYKDLPKVSFPFGFASAAGGDVFNDGYGCGACYEITCQGPFDEENTSCVCDGSTPTVVVQVTDECPECQTTHFDLNPNSMELIVGDGLSGTCGIINTQVRRVNCDFQSNIKIRSKEGTSQWWYGLHVDDVAGYGDISSVKLRDAKMSNFDITCTKNGGPTFWVCDVESFKPLAAPMDVELIDSAGRKLVGSNVITNLAGSQEFDFGSNFEDIPPAAPVAPTRAPTPAPVTPNPTPAPTQTAKPTAESLLLTTANAKSAWDVFKGLKLLTKTNSVNPPSYSLVASGGAAGGGGSVVTESQAYALLVTGIVLASWDEHAGKEAGADREEVLDAFEGYYNFWKKMCQNSVGGSTCQDAGNWNHCHDTVTNKKSVCLPDWKQKADGSRTEGTGPAPDGDEDAIVGIILAIKAVANDNGKPSWYDDARKWADASSTAFFQFNVETTYFNQQTEHRMLKLGACWGGWESNGNNPSYHSPGSFKVMRDFQNEFPNADRKGKYSGIPSDEWNKLIASSYQALNAVQCGADGALVPNWSTFTIGSNDRVQNWGGRFSGSGTPQNEYGAEASRTTWRVALDAALYPQDASDWSEYLDSFVSRLRGGYTGSGPKFWMSNTFPSCGPDQNPGNDSYSMFGNWRDNAFMYGPTFSALIAGDPGDGDLIDAAGEILGGALPPDYYHRCWALLSNLMISGAIESAGRSL